VKRTEIEPATSWLQSMDRRHIHPAICWFPFSKASRVSGSGIRIVRVLPGATWQILDTPRGVNRTLQLNARQQQRTETSSVPLTAAHANGPGARAAFRLEDAPSRRAGYRTGRRSAHTSTGRRGYRRFIATRSTGFAGKIGTGPRSTGIGAKVVSSSDAVLNGCRFKGWIDGANVASRTRVTVSGGNYCENGRRGIALHSGDHVVVRSTGLAQRRRWDNRRRHLQRQQRSLLAPLD
jgi:hypothetical protein